MLCVSSCVLSLKDAGQANEEASFLILQPPKTQKIKNVQTANLVNIVQKNQLLNGMATLEERKLWKMDKKQAKHQPDLIVSLRSNQKVQPH